MASLPAVRELSANLATVNIDSLLINIHDPLGAVLTERFDFVFSPTFLVFAADGREVLRTNAVPRLDDIRLAVTFGL